MTRILVVNLGLLRLTIRTLINILFVLYEIYVLLLLENFTFLRFLSKGSICFLFWLCVYECFDVLSVPIFGTIQF